MVTYSNLAHVPWAIGLQMIGVALLRWSAFRQPAAWWISGLGGWAAMFARDEAKQEYMFINDRFGGLRANMPDLYALQFWRWSVHNLTETAWAGLAVILIAACAQLRHRRG